MNVIYYYYYYDITLVYYIIILLYFITMVVLYAGCRVVTKVDCAVLAGWKKRESKNQKRFVFNSPCELVVPWYCTTVVPYLRDAPEAITY